MGRMLPSPENILKTAINVTRFGGLNNDEKRRIIAIDLPSAERAKANPNLICGAWGEWAHNLQADEQKAPEGHITRERKWYGSYICLGHEDTIRSERFDAVNCPACAYAAQSEEFVPERHHAMNIIVYATRSGTYDLVEPYSVQLLPWRISERRYKPITDLWQEYGDLQIKDLLIHCTVKQWQTYDIQVAANTAWLDPRYNTGKQPGGVPKYGMDLRDLVLQTYRENKLTDPELASVIATHVGAATLREKSSQLAAYLGVGASGAVSIPGSPSPAQVMSPDDISAMLSNPSPGVATDQAAQVAQATGGREPAPAQEPVLSPDDLGVPPAQEAPPEPAQPQEQPIPDTTPTNDDIPTPEPVQQVSLDDLLSS